MTIKNIVLEIAYEQISIGFAGEQNPRFIFPSIVGYLQDKKMIQFDNSSYKTFIGIDNIKLNQFLIQENVFNTIPFSRSNNYYNWKVFKDLLSIVFNRVLKINTSNCNLIYVAPHFMKKEDAEHICKYLFDDFHFKGILFVHKASCGLFASKIKTGLFIEISSYEILILPIHEGFPPGMATTDLSKNRNEYTLNASILADSIMDTINMVDIDLRNEIFANIVIYSRIDIQGDFSNFILNSLRKLKPDFSTKIDFYRNLDNIIWKGASIVGNLSSIGKFIVSENNYLAKSPFLY